MKRETLFAIGLGVLLGMGIGLFVLFNSSSNDEAKVIPVSGDTENSKVVNTALSDNQLLLTVTAPSDNVVFNSKDIEVTGKASKGSLVVIQSPVSSEVFINENEQFSVPFKLALGENIISISSYSESSTPQEKILKVFYIEE